MSDNGGLVQWDGDGTIALGSFSLMRVGLLVNGEPTFEEWQNVRQLLSHIEGAVHWWIGDWLNYGEQRWGEMYTQALEETNFEYSTLRDAKWVSGAVQLSSRDDKLSFKHHRVVAPLPPAQQRRWLSKAKKEGWSAQDLRTQIRESAALEHTEPTVEGCTVDDLSKLLEKGTRFGTVYLATWIQAGMPVGGRGVRRADIFAQFCDREP